MGFMYRKKTFNWQNMFDTILCNIYDTFTSTLQGYYNNTRTNFFLTTQLTPHVFQKYSVTHKYFALKYDVGQM